MAYPLQVYSPSELIYGYLLASRYRSPWVYEPSNALLTEPDVWEIVRNDTDVLATIQRRNQNLIRPWRVVPNEHAASKNADPAQGDASKRLAAIAHEGLSYITRFDAARRTLAEAFFLGRRYGKIEWKELYTSLDGSPELLWYVPVRIRDIDRRRFHWVPEWSDGNDGVSRKTGVHLEMFDTNRLEWTEVSVDERRSLVEYIWEDTEDRIGHGRGALEALFFTHYFKTGTLKKLIEGIDRYANGFLIGKLDSLRSASTDLTNEQLTNRLKTLLSTMRSEHYAIIGEGDKVELLEMQGTGLQVALDLVRYFNESAERLCNGSVRPAGHSVDGTGSRAAASEEAETSEAFYQFPREDLDSVLDRDLLSSFLYFNEGNLATLGLDRAKRPRFTSAQIRRQDPSEAVERMNSVIGAGVPVLRSEYYEHAQLTPPGPDDDVIQGRMGPEDLDPDTGEPVSQDAPDAGDSKGKTSAQRKDKRPHAPPRR